MTRRQIIDEALAKAGRTDLLSNARLWLNLVLEELYRDNDWPWALKHAAGLVFTDGGALPDDYYRHNYAKIIDSSGNRTPLLFVGPEEFADLNVSNSHQGKPAYVFVDSESMTYKAWPHPNAAYTWDLGYYRAPSLGDTSSSANDNDEVSWQGNILVLIQGVYCHALQYQDDNRYEGEVQKLYQLIGKTRMNSKDLRGGHNRMKLGKSFKRRF